MKDKCPHCGKEISIRVEKEDEVEKEVLRVTQALRQEISKLRAKIKTSE